MTRLDGLSIREAETPKDFDAFSALIRNYVDWCRVRYADNVWLVETAFGHQALDAELAQLSEKYSPPAGRTLLAFDAERAIGAVAYRRLSDNVCEMKRLYVLEGYAGRGVGKALCETLIGCARTEGYEVMRLDTTRDMREAIALYHKLGFAPCDPYNDYPEKMREMIVYLEAHLAAC